MNEVQIKHHIHLSTKCSVKPTEQEMWEVAKLCVDLHEDFNHVFKFVNAHKNVPAPVMIEALRSVKQRKPGDPWAYGQAVIRKIAPQFYARREEKINNERKKMQSTADILEGVMRRKKGYEERR